MARITVEDCTKKVDNRFDLVLLAAQRSRQLSAGAETRIDRNDEKTPVLALREIAGDVVKLEELKEALIQSTLYNAQESLLAEETEELLIKEIENSMAETKNEKKEAAEEELSEEEIFAKALGELADSLPDELDAEMAIQFDEE